MSATRDALMAELNRAEERIKHLAGEARQHSSELILLLVGVQEGTPEALAEFGSEFGRDGGQSGGAEATQKLAAIRKCATEARGLAHRMTKLQGQLASK